VPGNSRLFPNGGYASKAFCSDLSESVSPLQLPEAMFFISFKKRFFLLQIASFASILVILFFIILN
jgi:hypothetical protein